MIINNTSYEIVNIDGEEKKVKVDWSLYKGSNIKRSKDVFIKVTYYLNLVGGKINKCYNGSKDKISYEVYGESYEFCNADALIKNIRSKINNEKKYEGKKVETINIDGEEKKIEVDWSLYEGGNIKRSREVFIKVIYYLNLVGGRLTKNYKGSTSQISYKIDNKSYTFCNTDTLIKNIKLRLNNEKKYEGKKVETINIDGEEKKIEVDWNLYKGPNGIGSNANKCRRVFIRINYYIQLIGGKFVREFKNSQTTIFYKVKNNEYSFSTSDTLIDSIKKQIECKQIYNSGIKMETIEVNGEEVMVAVDWGMYDGITYGRGAHGNMEGYKRLIYELSLVGGVLESTFKNTDTHVRLKIDKAQYDIIANNVGRTVNRILSFKDLCAREGDTFEEVHDVDERGYTKAKIKLKHGTIIEQDYNSYVCIIRARSKLVNRIEELSNKLDTDINIMTDYIDSHKKIKIKFGDVIISKYACNFNKVLEYIEIFLETLKLNKHHKFIRFYKYEKYAKGLSVELETTHNGVNSKFQIPISKYNYSNSGFLTGEKKCYEYEKNSGDKLLTPYTGGNKYLIVECKHGVFPRRAADYYIGGKGCIECGSDKIRGENNYCYKGGITPLNNYLRGKISKWINDTKKVYEYRCIITGKSDNIVVHHLYNFYKIVEETLEILGLEARGEIKNYTNYELKLITEKCLDLHYKYGLGVVISKELHRLYHCTYGYENTPEQFFEFKKLIEKQSKYI